MMLRNIAQTRCARVVEVWIKDIRNPVDDFRMYAVVRQPDQHKLSEVFRVYPSGKSSPVFRSKQSRSDSDGECSHSKFVGVEHAQAFAEHFGRPVQ